MNIKKLGDAELEIMEELWDSSEPLTSGYILEKIRPTRKWALSTLMATLARLTEKGFVYCDRSTRTNYYTAVITAEEYRASEGTSFIRKLYGGSVKRLVASLYDCQELDAKDIAELRAFLDELERKE